LADHVKLAKRLKDKRQRRLLKHEEAERVRAEQIAAELRQKRKEGNRNMAAHRSKGPSGRHRSHGDTGDHHDHNHRSLQPQQTPLYSPPHKSRHQNRHGDDSDSDSHRPRNYQSHHSQYNADYLPEHNNNGRRRRRPAYEIDNDDDDDVEPTRHARPQSKYRDKQSRFEDMSDVSVDSDDMQTYLRNADVMDSIDVADREFDQRVRAEV
jgi:hypothetical protein